MTTPITTVANLDQLLSRKTPMTESNADLVRQLLALLSPSQPVSAPATEAWTVGKAYLIRTVTMTWTGQLVAITPTELVLEDPAWIADTGRYSQATTADSLSEVEPRDGPVIIGRGAVVDAVEWTTKLPRKQK